MDRSEEHTSELQSHSDLHSFPTRRSSDLLGIEATGEGIVFRKDSAIGLQVVFGDALTIHPQTYAFVADELHNAYRFFNSSKLFLIAIKFVLVDQHGQIGRAHV